MTEAQQLADDGLRFQEEALGNQTFVYRGKHWPCMFAQVQEGSTLVPGGFEDEAEAILIVRKTAITPIRTADQNELWTGDSTSVTADSDVMPPRCGKIVRGPDGKLYRIGSKIKTTSVSWTCPLIAADRG